MSKPIPAPRALGGALIALAAAPALAATPLPPVDTSALRAAVTLGGVRAHQQTLQDIADAHGGTRALGTPGYTASVDYVVEQLLQAGYIVKRLPFDIANWEELSDPVLEKADPVVPFPPDGFSTMDGSGAGNVTGPVVAVNVVIPPGAPGTSPSGCEAADFAGLPAGAIALIQRGTCTFRQKALNAQAAGAAGAIIFNEGQPGRDGVLNGTLGEPGDITIPVIGTSFAIGAELAAAPVPVHMVVDSRIEHIQSENVIAETARGRGNRVVMAGAHLDSVPEGPGINDNGSGTATLLEVALQMARLNIVPYNKVRFGFWGAEEAGLIGSTRYVASLSERDIGRIAVYLNFDMLGSPNFVRFVYDGDGSAGLSGPGPDGSDLIEQVFDDYFAGQSLPTEPTAFDGRSDYGPFIAIGIPAGGLFSGAEALKTEAQAAVYGGNADEAYDRCYHQACDNINNVLPTGDISIDQFSDATAHSVLMFSQNALPRTFAAPTLRGRTAVKRFSPEDAPYRGPRLQR